MTEMHVGPKWQERLKDRFKRRSRMLRYEAYSFLVAIIVLMIGGVLIFLRAADLTKKDVASTIHEHEVSTQSELSKLRARQDDIVAAATPEFKKCLPAYRSYFGPWEYKDGVDPKPGTAWHGIGYQTPLPSGDQLASDISAMLESKEVPHESESVGIQLMFSGCGGPDIFISKSRSEYVNIVAGLKNREFSFQREQLNVLWAEYLANVPRISFLQDVERKIYEQKVEATAGSATAPHQDDGNELLLGLIQTSVTRFGTLAVIGFFVSLLASLYRYNVRLAGFYDARADLLEMYEGATSVSDFVSLAAALTPQVDFGKGPETPISELLAIISAAKESGKALPD